MAMTFKQFVERAGAEVVGDRIIVGERAGRDFVGSIEDGTFTLNARGQELLELFESEDAKPKRGKKTEAAAEASAVEPEAPVGE